jgi:hypothetical protein
MTVNIGMEYDVDDKCPFLNGPVKIHIIKSKYVDRPSAVCDINECQNLICNLNRISNIHYPLGTNPIGLK